VFIFDALRCDVFKQLLEPENQSELFIISLTTSSRALDGDEGGEEAECIEGEDGKPICNKVNFWFDRTFVNKIQWMIYKMVRFFFVVCYFYFYPMLLVFGNAAGSFYFAEASK